MKTKFRPSNGSEGDWFETEFCQRCIYYKDEECPIILLAMIHSIDEMEYPGCWQTVNNKNICTIFCEKEVPNA